MKIESIFIPTLQPHLLHLRRFYTQEEAVKIWMLHGSVENGKIFYSENGKGLAPYLAQQGFDVYVLDLRGRGQSTPPISSESSDGQFETIIQDLPLVLDHLQNINPAASLHVIAHSWGGVLLNSFLARFPHRVEQVQSMICFGSKRNINTFSLKKAWVIDFLWDFIGGRISRKKGYLPAKALRFGSDDEPLRYYLDVVKWAKPKSPWIDTHDGFDYAQAIQKIELPSTLYLAGASDAYLGNPRDVIDFMKESGEKNACYRLLSKTKGNLHNYGHIDMLTHPDAVKDHFPSVLDWIHQHTKK